MFQNKSKKKLVKEIKNRVTGIVSYVYSQDGKQSVEVEYTNQFPQLSNPIYQNSFSGINN